MSEERSSSLNREFPVDRSVETKRNLALGQIPIPTLRTRRPERRHPLIRQIVGVVDVGAANRREG